MKNILILAIILLGSSVAFASPKGTTKKASSTVMFYKHPNKATYAHDPTYEQKSFASSTNSVSAHYKHGQRKSKVQSAEVSTSKSGSRTAQSHKHPLGLSK